MNPNDLEIGPSQRTFESLFKSIGLYFQSALVYPVGSVTETNLSTFSQEQLHKTLNAVLEHYGFTDFPYSIRVNCEENSRISGIYRSDNIATYEETMDDGSRRTFNFYSNFGPEKMKVSFYWLDMKKGGEEIHGILTVDDRWYFRISTTDGFVFYQRMEQAKHHW